MVLKLCRNKDYDDIKSEEIQYKGNVKDILCHYPLNEEKAPQTATIYYQDGSEETIIIGEYNEEKTVYLPTYKYVFLMSDEGKTIERIV